jgi:hypothetical protein
MTQKGRGSEAAIWPLGKRRERRYLADMSRHPALLPLKAVALAAATFALAALAGLGFAGWVSQGGGIFMALIESGLAWCM